MIHSVILIRVVLHTDASSHMTKCHMCLPFGLVVSVWINKLFVRKHTCTLIIHSKPVRFLQINQINILKLSP